MEKKNTILLTVIAVATLLVAVVGATFAYFTASVTTENKENNTTTVQTRTIASATMDFGSKVEASNVLPGYKTVKTVTVAGNGSAGDVDVNATITLTPSVADFGNHIKYSIYKVATATAPDASTICGESTPVTDGGQYYDSMTCTTTSLGTAVKSGTFGATAETLDVTISYNTADTYYVVVEYENDTTADQNSEQGKTFSVVMDFAAKA